MGVARRGGVVWATSAAAAVAVAGVAGGEGKSSYSRCSRRRSMELRARPALLLPPPLSLAATVFNLSRRNAKLAADAADGGRADAAAAARAAAAFAAWTASSSTGGTAAASPKSARRALSRRSRRMLEGLISWWRTRHTLCRCSSPRAASRTIRTRSHHVSGGGDAVCPSARSRSSPWCVRSTRSSRVPPTINGKTRQHAGWPRLYPSRGSTLGCSHVLSSSTSYCVSSPQSTCTRLMAHKPACDSDGSEALYTVPYVPEAMQCLGLKPPVAKCSSCARSCVGARSSLPGEVSSRLTPSLAKTAKEDSCHST